MTEEKKEPGDVPTHGDAARIAELERENEKLRRENRALLGKKKMLTTSAISTPPLGQPRPSIMISTTIRKPHPVGHQPMIQSHNLPAPETPEQTTEKILNRVKKDRAAGMSKEAKTK